MTSPRATMDCVRGRPEEALGLHEGEDRGYGLCKNASEGPSSQERGDACHGTVDVVLAYHFRSDPGDDCPGRIFYDAVEKENAHLRAR